MTVIRRGGDAEMRCDRVGCLLMRLASQLGLPANVSGKAFRDAIAREGWVSRRATMPPGEGSRVATRMEDYCPAHTATGTTDEDWGLPYTGEDGDLAQDDARDFLRVDSAMPGADDRPPDEGER
jgi:hypothetical protein